MNVLDLFDEEEVPTPDSQIQSDFPPAQASRVPSDKPLPTFREHLCSVVGCAAWGCYGMFGVKIEESTWWCREHCPSGFLPKDRR